MIKRTQITDSRLPTVISAANKGYKHASVYIEEEQCYFEYVMAGDIIQIPAEIETIPAANSGVWAKVGTTQKQLDSKVAKILPLRYIRCWSNGSTSNGGNHWLRLRLFSKDGLQIFANSITKSNGDGITVPMEVPGEEVLSSPYSSGIGLGLDHILADYGDVVEFPSLINMWMYYHDGRTYHDVKVETSIDNVTWNTIYSSDVDGDYTPSTVPLSLIRDGNIGLIPKTEIINEHVDIVTDASKSVHLSVVDRAKIDGIIESDPFAAGGLLPSNWYEVLQGSPSNMYPPEWTGINGSVDENWIADNDGVTGSGTPNGKPGFVWHCKTNTTTGTNGLADGGYNGKAYPIDNTKTYRTVIWVRKPDKSPLGVSLNNGTIYTGMRCTTSAGASVPAIRSNGTPHSNIYYWNGDVPTPDQWYALVSFIRPVGSPNITSAQFKGGLYKMGASVRVAPSVEEPSFPATAATLSSRAYLYYSTQAENEIQFFHPRMDLVDGTEVPLEDILQIQPISLTVESVEKVAGLYWDDTTNTIRFFDGINHREINSTIV